MNSQNQFLTLILFSFFFSLPVNSQQNENPDSLFFKLEHAHTQEERAEAYYELAYFYDRDENYDLAIENFEKALGEFKELNNYKRQVDIYNCLGANYELKGESEKSILHFRNSLQIAKTINDSNGMGDALHNLGIMAKHYLSYDSAAWYFAQAISVREKLEDRSEYSASLIAMAEVLDNLGHHQEALKYCQGVYKIEEGIKEPITHAILLMMMAEIYSNLNLPDSVVYFYTQMINVSKKSGFQRGLAVAYANLGSFYLENGELKKALENQMLSLRIEKKLNHEYGIMSSYCLVAEVYTTMKEYKKALYYLQKSEELCDSTMLEDYSNLLEGYYQVHKGLGNHKLALNYHEKYIDFHGQVTELEVQEKVAEIENKYETEKKTQEIKILQQENQLKAQSVKLLFYMLAALGLILGLLVLLIIRIKQQNNVKMNSMKLELENYLLQISEFNNPGTVPDKKNFHVNFLSKYDISERESQVLNLIAVGYSNAQIAGKIFVSTNTVKYHIKNIYLKLDVKNRVEALNKLKSAS